MKKKNRILFTGGIIVLFLIVISTIWNVQSAQKQTHIVAEKVSDFYIEELINRRVSIISDALKQNFQYMRNALDSITSEDLSSISNWTPIGYFSGVPKYFQGTYNGNNKNISGIQKTYSTNNKTIGLFGALKTGTIKNTEGVAIKDDFNLDKFVYKRIKL